MTITDKERDKYERAWELDGYMDHSPGVFYADFFQNVVKPRDGASILDVGAGVGAGSRALKDRGFAVTAFDLVGNNWRHNDIRLIRGCIWHDLRGTYEHVYCCDVMEHIPTQLTGLAVREILDVCKTAFIAISFMQDNHGDALRDRLHLTVQPFVWWRDLFMELGSIHSARDLLGMGVFHVSR
jgi:2-polyprenyl-3-methyl-5-hydroxy-6-metoxy-1,4-benzoquinol methylase